MNYWNEIYSHFSPIAFDAFGFSVHWYGMAYVSALILVIILGKYFANKMPRFEELDKREKNSEFSLIESYFLWVEVGVILGARFGYLLIYTDNAMYYLTQPWQAFNPYVDGEFVGIAGMSYHGAVIGFLIASFGFAYFRKLSKALILKLLDLVAISLPLAYVLGRIGNFLNKELYGRAIEIDSLKFMGIYIDGALRYPSQLIEAFLEGIVVFFIVLFVSKKTRKDGILIVTYAFGYGCTRFIAEFTREADIQMGYYALGLSMGQILSIVLILMGFILLYFVKMQGKNVR